MATAPPDMEWQVPTQGLRADIHRLRCFPLEMGSNMQWDTDRRPVVGTGEDMAHQLPGIASSLSCSSDIPEGQVRSLDAIYCSWTILLQWPTSTIRRGVVFTFDQSGKVSVAMVPSERYLIDSPRVSNLVADTEYRTMRNRTDWKLSPVIFNSIIQIFGPLEVNLFSSRLTYLLPRYFSWRPDPLVEATDSFQ